MRNNSSDGNKGYNGRDNKGQAADESEIIYGRNAVAEALKAGVPLNKLIIARGDLSGSIRTITASAKEAGIMCVYVEREKLDTLCGGRSHQGVAAYISPEDYAEPEDILNIAAERGEPPFVIVLDEIQDPHNLGAVIRTADAVGAHGIIIPKHRAAALTATVAKTSAGASAHVAVARVTNIPNTIDLLKEKGLWIAGTALDGDMPFYEADFKGAIALVIGNEGKGMGNLVRKKCDYIVSIPMSGHVSSLNASVAAGVVMYEIYKQHRGSNK